MIPTHRINAKGRIYGRSFGQNEASVQGVFPAAVDPSMEAAGKTSCFSRPEKRLGLTTREVRLTYANQYHWDQRPECWHERYGRS